MSLHQCLGCGYLTDKLQNLLEVAHLIHKDSYRIRCPQCDYATPAIGAYSSTIPEPGWELVETNKGFYVRSPMGQHALSKTHYLWVLNPPYTNTMSLSDMQKNLLFQGERRLNMFHEEHDRLLAQHGPLTGDQYKDILAEKADSLRKMYQISPYDGTIHRSGNLYLKKVLQWVIDRRNGTPNVTDWERL